MRKILAIGLILVMVVIGFTAMVNPVASDDGCVSISKDVTQTCEFKGYDIRLWDTYYPPLGEKVYWWMTITVTNNLGYTMENVHVKDRLGGELEVVEVKPHVGTATFETKGASEKVFVEWHIGTLAPGTVTLKFAISTDLNPGGKQEYTSTGDYYLNSGATLKWLDLDGKKHSLTSNQIMVTVVGEEEE